MESLWIEFWVTSKDLNAHALAENEGFCNTNSIEKTDTKSKPTTIREHFFIVVIFLELIRYTYFNQKG